MLWTVYFDHGTPFGGPRNRIFTTTSFFSGQHTGTTGTVIAHDPGDYKYGVQVENPLNHVLLGDDDPRLIVRP
jgi:hypothetical protein